MMIGCETDSMIDALVAGHESESRRVLDILNAARAVLAQVAVFKQEWRPATLTDVQYDTHYDAHGDQKDIQPGESRVLRFWTDKPFSLRQIVVDDESAPHFNIQSCHLGSGGLSLDKEAWKAVDAEGFSATYFAESNPDRIIFENKIAGADRVVSVTVRNMSSEARRIKMWLVGEEQVNVRVPGKLDAVLDPVSAALNAADKMVWDSWVPREYATEAVVKPGTTTVQFGGKAKIPGTGLPGFPETQSVVSGLEHPFRVERLIVDDESAPNIRIDGFCIGNSNVMRTSDSYDGYKLTQSSEPIYFDGVFYDIGISFTVLVTNKTDKDQKVRLTVRGREER